jgi:hypothetical protein
VRRGAWAAAVLALAACAPPPTPPVHAVPAGPAITVQAAPVPLNEADPAQTRIGAFTYVGGLVLTSPDTTRLHGLSDLKLWPDGRLLSVSDEGDLLEARLAFDAAGRPAGLTRAALRPLGGPDGLPLSAAGKGESDSEGVAELANGDRLVSFERDHRILLYPHDGGPPRPAPAPAPAEGIPLNAGMEAIDAAPAAGPDAYVVGVEASGQTWLCRVSKGCAPSQRAEPPPEFGLTAVALLPGGGRAYLMRAFNVIQGVRIILRIVDAEGATVDELRLARPYTVDNFEGLAVLPQPDGALRFHLLVDDNFSRAERTLFLAFDWRPQQGKRP